MGLAGQTSYSHDFSGLCVLHNALLDATTTTSYGCAVCVQ